MSLGRHSGAALIGRPLDMSVQAVLEAQDDVAGQCMEADVFYADNKLEKSRVRISLEKSGSSPTQALIRIRSSVLVDEPVVTVYLRVGCQLKTERRYVLLAELVSEAASDRNLATPMPSPPVAPIKPAVVPSANADAGSVDAAAPKISKPVRRSRSREAAATAQVDPGNLTAAEGAQTLLAKEQAQTLRTKPQRPAVTSQDKKTAAPSKARLKLEPLDLVIERDPQLRASSELLSIPSANPQDRAAASALWQALTAQPQDILRDTEKLQGLENSVRGLQAQSQKSLSSIDDLNIKLQQAQAERYANALVYALAALLLAAIAGLVFALRHRLFGHRGGAADKPWWGKNEAFENQQEAWLDSSPSEEQSGPGPNRLVPVPKSILVDVDVDFDLDLASSKPGTARSGVAPNFVDSVPFSSKNGSGFGSSMLHPSRAVKAEELFDVQQQADFFVSIGQLDQAVEVLRSHIAENIETSALVYLDLFNLYHQLKRPAEYESLRETFNQRFNTQLPVFELYTDKNLGLESYQLALSRIEALWPSPKVLEIIEESLFRQSDSGTEAFNLEAYRELLLLYSVAKEIIGLEHGAVAAAKKFDLPDSPADSVDSRPMTFMSTAIQPLSASMDENQQGRQSMPAQPLMDSVVPPASLRLGLDIDLSIPLASNERADSGTPSDSQFFAQFDADAAAAAPALNPRTPAPAQAVADTDNLIDFDVFDVPQATSVKPRPPEA